MILTGSSRFARRISHKLPIQTKSSYVFWASKKQKSDYNKESKEFTVELKNNELLPKYSDGHTKVGVGSLEDRSSSIAQAPNRASIWSKSQNPRSRAMSGPRFEQTLFEFQPAPYSAIELSHKQPVRWSNQRATTCDGGGGPLGHPRIFINTDKPEICVCEYCGQPFAHEKHRKHIESLKLTAYPLAPIDDST